MGEWKYGLFGCFGNCSVCMITYCVYCYTAGKVAETTGRNCLVWGLLYTLFPCVIGCIVRGEIRNSKGIDGSPIGDFCAHLCLAHCALCQEARETGAIGHNDMAGGGYTVGGQVMERA